MKNATIRLSLNESEPYLFNMLSDGRGRAKILEESLHMVADYYHLSSSTADMRLLKKILIERTKNESISSPLPLSASPPIKMKRVPVKKEKSEQHQIKELQQEVKEFEPVPAKKINMKIVQEPTINDLKQETDKTPAIEISNSMTESIPLEIGEEPTVGSKEYLKKVLMAMDNDNQNGIWEMEQNRPF